MNNEMHRALYSTEAPTKEPYEFRLLNISAPIISEIRLNNEMLRNVDVLDKKLLLVAKKDFILDIFLNGVKRHDE